MEEKEIVVTILGIAGGVLISIVVSWIARAWQESMSAKERDAETLLAIEEQIERNKNTLWAIQKEVEDISRKLRLATDVPPPHYTEKEIMESVEKGKAWLDEVTIGQPTKDFL